MGCFTCGRFIPGIELVASVAMLEALTDILNVQVGAIEIQVTDDLIEMGKKSYCLGCAKLEIVAALDSQFMEVG